MELNLYQHTTATHMWPLSHVTASADGTAWDTGRYDGDGIAVLTARVATSGGVLVTFYEAAATSTWTACDPELRFATVTSAVSQQSIRVPFGQYSRFLRARPIVSSGAYDIGITVLARKKRVN